MDRNYTAFCGVFVRPFLASFLFPRWCTMPSNSLNLVKFPLRVYLKS
uniref:Uncharacterized protein n=1 Tax=Myoviridae sp. ctqfO1 TaxID=2827710 RepID=A0A8S5T3A1_9CAUD|nr:MAG TPA: hypothetical protein [Myoviridae sp. ctqfO1]